MFLAILAVVLLAVTIHAVRTAHGTSRRSGELALVYLLVGYCGLPMLLLAVAGLVSPEWSSRVFGIPGGNVQGAVALVTLGMALAAVLALRYRGTYLIGPAVAWAVYLGGGTFVHLHGGFGDLDPHHLLYIFATHGLVALILVGALLASGLLKER